MVCPLVKVSENPISIEEKRWWVQYEVYLLHNSQVILSFVSQQQESDDRLVYHDIFCDFSDFATRLP